MSERKMVSSLEDITSIRCSVEEAETTVGWMRDDSRIRIFTSDNKTLTKLKRVIAKNPSAWEYWDAGRDREGYVLGWNFTAPRDAVRFVARFERTEEQRQVARERTLARIAAGKFGFLKKDC